MSVINPELLLLVLMLRDRTETLEGINGGVFLRPLIFDLFRFFLGVETGLQIGLCLIHWLSVGGQRQLDLLRTRLKL